MSDARTPLLPLIVRGDRDDLWHVVDQNDFDVCVCEREEDAQQIAAVMNGWGNAQIRAADAEAKALLNAQTISGMQLHARRLEAWQERAVEVLEQGSRLLGEVDVETRVNADPETQGIPSERAS